MSVSILGTPVGPLKSGDPYTAEAGSNRAVIIALVHEQFGAAEYTTDLTLGGVSMTRLTEHYFQVASSNMVCEFYRLPEASLLAGAQTITVTGNGAGHSMVAYTLSGTSIPPELFAFSKDGNGADVLLQHNLATANNGIALSAWGCVLSGGGAAPTGWTLDYNTNFTEAGYAASFSHISTDGTTLTQTQPRSSSDPTLEQTLLGVSFNDVASPTVTQTDATPEDAVQQSFNTTELTAPTTAASIAGANVLPLLSDTDPATATTYTLDISAIEASTPLPRIGETVNLSVTATGGTATQELVIQPKTGWAFVVLAGTLDKSANSFLAEADSDLGITTAVGDIIYYDASNNAAITATGVYSSDLTTVGEFTAFVIQQGGSATTPATSIGGAFYPMGDVSDTVTVDQATAAPGDSITWTTSIVGVQQAYITDSLGNILYLTSVTDTGGTIPAVSDGLQGCLIEPNLTVTLSA